MRRMLADPKARALVTNFAGQWLYLRELKNANPDVTVFPDFDDNLRQALPARNGDALRQHRARGPLRARSARRRLHVRQRAARQALRHSERLRPRLPARAGAERCASRSARPGQPAAGHLDAEPHVAGHSRDVDPENLLGSPAPLPPPDVPASRGEARRPAARVGSRAHRAASRRIRPAPAATRSWIRSVWRSRTSTPSAAGAQTMRESRSTPPGSSWTARRSTARPALRKALLDDPDAFVASLTEKLLMYGVGRETTHSRHAGRARDHAGVPHAAISVLRSGTGNREQRAVPDARNERAERRRRVERSGRL